MKNPKIKIFGYKGAHSNTEAIEAGLVKLGCELSDKPDVVLELCGLYQTVEAFCATLNYTPKKIYNLLDIDPNKDISFYSQAINDLNKANIITTISPVVQNDMIVKLGIAKPIKVIYYPTKNINYLNYQKTLAFVHVGRIYSPNKRFNLALETLDLMGVPENSLIVVGSEKPRWGTYAPNMSDEDLNWLYNSAEFCFCLSSSEGLYLPAVEAVIGNCIPILCQDLEVGYDWGLEEFMAFPDAKSLAIKINEMHANKDKYNKIMANLRPDFIDKFSLDNFVKRLYNLICSV